MLLFYFCNFSYIFGNFFDPTIWQPSSFLCERRIGLKELFLPHPGKAELHPKNNLGRHLRKNCNDLRFTVFYRVFEFTAVKTHKMVTAFTATAFFCKFTNPHSLLIIFW